jgi:hypothetical protein
MDGPDLKILKIVIGSLVLCQGLLVVMTWFKIIGV